MADDPATEKEARHGGEIPAQLDPALMHDIQVILSRLVEKAPQLIQNFTTNLAENWMQIRCKFDGGKVINRSQSGSWEHRCCGAALQKNLGKCWGPQTWEKMTSSDANQVFVDVAESCAKKAKKDRKRKASEKAKESRRRSKYSKNDDSTAACKAYRHNDNDVEPDDVTSDVSPEYLEELKDGFYQTKVRVTQEQADEIERNTREQSGSELWKDERRKRVTASNIGVLSKMLKSTKRSKKVHELLYTRFKGSKATRYGISMEETTRQQYVTYLQKKGSAGFTTQDAGLVISVDTPWIAASPDGRVMDPTAAQSQGIVEYKNPYSVRDLTISEACDRQAKAFCLEKQEDDNQVTYKLKEKHNYYYQVQCQMYCCNVDWCDFVVRTNKELHVERIQRDKHWWEQKLPKLKEFYFQALLPELACPRKERGGKIREPPLPLH